MQTQELLPVDFKKKLQQRRTIVGIDYGTKRIGVAVSDLLWISATPLKIVGSIDELANLLSDRELAGFVIGMPKLMQGDEGSQAALTRAFGDKIKARFGLPVMYWDERLSSCAVSRVLVEQANLSRKRQKEVLDKVAAAYILQSALDFLSNC